MILDQPQNDQEKWKSLTLAASVHIALVVALFVGVQWKSKPPASVEVELWDSVPAGRQPPPPPPEMVRPEPKPEPKIEPKPEPKPDPKPDIAVKDDKKKDEPKKPEPPKKEEPKKPEPKPEPRTDPFREQLEREQKQLDQKKRMQQQATRADACLLYTSPSPRD